MNGEKDDQKGVLDVNNVNNFIVVKKVKAK